MNNTNTAKSNLYFYGALACAIWFLLTGWLWAYLVNLIVAYPFGILGLVLWYKGKKTEGNSKRYKVVEIILLTGLAASIITFIGMMMYN